MDHGLVAFVPLPLVVFALVVVIEGLVHIHACLRHTRIRAFQTPVNVVVIGEIYLEVVRLKVAAILALEFVVTRLRV
jgi:hypothetical protein